MDVSTYKQLVEEQGAVATTEQTLDKINQSDLNAFTQVFDDAARARARELEALPASARGRLHGVAIAVKDELAVKGFVTGSGTQANSTPAPENSHTVQRLEDEGAIMIGHTAMPEFGAWPFTESTHREPTKNPHNLAYSPGGSSGGTAASVAGGLVPVAIGSDGGGSIRIPSAHCGLVGLKPARGRVSPYPRPHGWWSLGTIGPLTNTIEDTALIYDIISGNQPSDRYRASFKSSFSDIEPAENLRFMVVTETIVPTHPEHQHAARSLAKTLQDLGHSWMAGPRQLPNPTTAFIPQFLSALLTEAQQVEHPELLEKRTRVAVRMGGAVSVNNRNRAARLGQKLAEKLDALFETVDVIITPTVADRPPKVGILDGKGAVGAMLASVPFVAYTALCNVTGHPALSIPCGVAEDSLPIGVQLIAHDEATLIAIARQLEN